MFIFKMPLEQNFHAFLFWLIYTSFDAELNADHEYVAVRFFGIFFRVEKVGTTQNAQKTDFFEKSPQLFFLAVQRSAVSIFGFSVEN